MKRALFLLVALCLTVGASAATFNFDNGWKFTLDAPENAQDISFDDTSWRSLDLPHDWSIEFAAVQDATSGNAGGFFPTGTGWYRKHYAYTPTAGHKRLYFEGVYMNAQVYVNGTLAGEHPYGYTSFDIDITPFLKSGDNVIAVKVDNSQQENCRWYSGSGIYRHVWMIDEPEVHFEHQGTYVTTPEVSTVQATVNVKTIVINDSKTDYKGSVEIVLNGYRGAVEKNLSSYGQEAGRATIPVSVAAGDTVTVAYDFKVAAPALWNPESPALYLARLSVGDHRVEQIFGIRSIRWNSAEGFVLNGKRILLNGGCVHHDHGIIGAASFDAAEYRKARQLKEAGFNAVRTSHNPPAPAFLDACDEYGILVIDESFDGWRTQKSPYDYSKLFNQWYAQDVYSMVRRDRNHPSIIMWSTGNEVIERKELAVVKTAKQLRDAVRDYDTTRPVTSALASWDRDWDIYDPLADVHDIVGYNYMLQHSATDHIRVPERVMVQTESYPNDAFRNWVYCQDNDYIIGDFVWTSIDYLGESGIGKYYYRGDPRPSFHTSGQFPYHGAYCGDIDLTGWRKPISHYRDIIWNGDANSLYMAVREPNGYNGEVRTTGWAVYPTWECWEWPGWEGKPVTVEVYSKAPEVSLYLNGKLIDTGKTDRSTQFKASFEVPYEPGTLRAVASGKSCEISTPGKPYAIRLTPENPSLNSGTGEIAYVTVEVVDRQGNVCPNAEVGLSFAVSGPGTLMAAGNANLEDTGSYADGYHATWKGRAMAVVRSNGQTGRCTLTVSAPGLRSGRVSFNVVM